MPIHIGDIVYLQPANGPAIRAAVIFNAPIDGMTTYTTEVLPAGAAQNARPAHPLPPRARASHRVRPPRGLSPRKHLRPPGRRPDFRVIQSQQLFLADPTMQNNRQAVLIWDLPTRLFHWALVVCIVGAFVTVKLGGLYMDWHIRFGCATLGLLLFRLIWGFIGPRYARFSQFLRGPAAVARYLKGPPRPPGTIRWGRCRCWRCCWCWASRRSAACSPPTTSWCKGRCTATSPKPLPAQ